MTEIVRYFTEAGEPFAAGFFLHENASLFRRYAEALGKFFADAILPGYAGGALYPSGGLGYRRQHYAVYPHYNFTFTTEKTRYAALAEPFRRRLDEEMRQPFYPPTPHRVGGYAWTHSIPNFERVEKEGLLRYRERIEARPDDDFRAGLLALLDGIEIHHRRALEKLRAENASPALIEALEQVPMRPARTLYEAIVCRNFVYFLDGCDDPGRLDVELLPYYNGEDMTAVFAEYFDNVDANDGWSAALGPDTNPLTIQLLRAIHGKRRPSLELRVTEHTPDEVWAEALAAVKSGGGSPSFYNERLYQEGLAANFPELSAEDRMRFNGGGCTETMLSGISRVGSTDAGINTALVFSQILREKLPEAPDFEWFYRALMDEMRTVTNDTLDKLEQIYRERAEILPHPIRTLLIDDCIDNGLDFNAGGARANWSVINFAGMINVIDSLLAIRTLIFEQAEVKPDAFIAGLDAEDPALYERFAACPHFGVDNEEADALAARFTGDCFALLDGRTPELGGKYLPASIQFTTYQYAGREVAATPDGRKNGAPLCDSVGAIHGNDIEGPTALLRSVSRLNLSKALGTPVLNFKIRPEHVDTMLRPLVETFFQMGGMQMQVSCVDRAEILDAMAHPEKHRNLIVRVGGYSEYWSRLSPELRQTVLERTMY